MEQNKDIVDLISNLLDSGKYKEALNVPNQDKYCNSFKDNCWDLISVIVRKIQDDTLILKPSLHSVCEELLSLIVLKVTPEEALLEFIEQIELAKNDAQFSIILQPLQQILIKLSVKRGRSLEWCLNSISTYIEKIHVTEYNLEGRERLLMDCNTNVRRIVKIYSLLPQFYEPFVTELQVESNEKTKQIITAFLVSLLGKPLIYIDLVPANNACGEGRQCCTSIVQNICKLEKDVLKFLVCVETCNRENEKTKFKNNLNVDNKEEIQPYYQREKINMTTLSGLFFTVFSGHFEVPVTAIPQIYSIEYVAHTTMLCVLHLLTFTEYGPLAKAISLFKTLLNRFASNISHTLLSYSVHFEICKNLVNIAIYSSYESIRKDAVQHIGYHVNKFDYKGRYILIKYLLENANHSGMIGYTITLLKNSINEAFTEPALPDCFVGTQLMQIVNKICYLPYGAESDLVELADQIITCLNFLRYLAIKDTENKTKIRESFSIIETNYLEKLRTGLNMSKAHYEVKLKDIEEGKDFSGETNIMINVGGNILDKIPTENKKEIIHSALNAFHLIECLVARLADCISINKLQVLNEDCQ